MIEPNDLDIYLTQFLLNAHESTSVKIEPYFETIWTQHTVNNSFLHLTRFVYSNYKYTLKSTSRSETKKKYLLPRWNTKATQ